MVKVMYQLNWMVLKLDSFRNRKANNCLAVKLK